VSDPGGAETIIVGAGPSGLAVAACLRRWGLPFTILEQSERVGATWRTHYERLHLHTARPHSGLPHWPMPADYPMYPSRQQVVDYLEAYAERFELRPRFGSRVVSARRHPAGWRVTCASGETHEGARLVVASGYNRVPFIPEVEGIATFPGEIVHSARYGDGARFAGQEVLVVGCGNSGAEIAIDLWERGARPALCVRGPLHIVPRDIFGLPAQRTTILLSRLPARLVDRLTLPLARRLIGDLSPWGIERPDVGPLEQIERDGRVPLIDVGTVDLIRCGAVRVVKGVAAVEASEVTFDDGARHRFDAIVFATGYRAKLGDFLEDAPAVTDDRGYPTVHGRESHLPGLYFCGFRNPTTGALRESALEGARIADHIARVSA